MTAVKQPNLPHKAGHILLGEKYSKQLKAPMEDWGLIPVFIPDNPDIDARVSGHTDLSVLHGGDNKLWLAPYLQSTDFAEKMLDMGYELCFPHIKQSCEYPFDAALNICCVGGNIIYNPRTAAKDIVESFINYNLLPVRQGYSRCSVCIVSERAIITADRGIGEAASKAGLDVLLISQGNILLPGFDYGFIGGSAFKIAENKLAFTGSLDAHPDKGAILDFLAIHSVAPVFLTDQPLFDIGSAIAVSEK